MRIAVMALQGAFVEHERMLARLGVESFEVRGRADWQQPKDGLILPGGESTTQRKLLGELGLLEPVRRDIADGLPVFGTCAGLILLARELVSDTLGGADGGRPLQGIATMDISARRNAYGRQLGSFATEADMVGVGRVPMTFIRAPYIEAVHGDAVPLANVDGHIVAARQRNQLVTAFHPELNDDLRVHGFFMDMVRRAAEGVK